MLSKIHCMFAIARSGATQFNFYEDNYKKK